MLHLWRIWAFSQVFPHGTGKSKGKGKEQTICYNCGNSGHIAANCPKGKGKGATMKWFSSGKGATGQWNIGAMQQSGPVAGNQIDTNQIDFTPPMWDNADQAIEADFGGSWDAAINEASMDNQWTVVTRGARQWRHEANQVWEKLLPKRQSRAQH